jgi:hypothetical protein
MAVHPGYRENSFDCLLHSLMLRKRRTAKSALWPMGDTPDDLSSLQRGMAGGPTGQEGDVVRSAVAAMFLRDELALPSFEADGSVVMR